MSEELAPYGNPEEERGNSNISIIPEPEPVGGVVAIEQQRAIAETQAAMIIAKQFPRNVKECLDNILNACARLRLAEAATYQYAKGGTNIEGGSIRLAECMAQNWKNMQFGIRELERRPMYSLCEAFAWDIENNVREVKIFQVPHIRHTRKGDYDLTDPREIYENVANMGARRLRSCIFGVIPGDIQEEALAQCDSTLKAKINITPEKIASLVEKFAALGVTKAAIEKRIQRRIEGITPAQVIGLGKVYNSLKDGMSVADDWFDLTDSEAVEEKTAAKAEELKERIGKQKPKKTVDTEEQSDRTEDGIPR